MIVLALACFVVTGFAGNFVIPTIPNKDGGTLNPALPWNVDCGEAGIIGLFSSGDGYSKVSKIKCQELPCIDTSDCVQIFVHGNDGGPRTADATWRAECPAQYVLTSLWDDDDEFGDIDYAKCCKIVQTQAYIDYSKCTAYFPLNTNNDGGPVLPNVEWNTECPNGEYGVALYDDDDRFRDVDGFKCCPLVYNKCPCTKEIDTSLEYCISGCCEVGILAKAKTSDDKTIAYILDETDKTCSIKKDGVITKGPIALTDELYYDCESELIDIAKGYNCTVSDLGSAHAIIEAIQSYFTSETGLDIKLVALYGVFIFWIFVGLACVLYTCINQIRNTLASNKGFQYTNLDGMGSVTLTSGTETAQQ